MDIDFSKANDLPKGASKFWRTFARAEFALKEYGLLKQKKQAEACWDQFAAELDERCNEGTFFSVVSAAKEAETLINEPPERQVRAGKNLDFEKSNPATDSVQLFASVRRVRNNLLHGGKHGDEKARERNEMLVAEAQAVLEHALSLHEDVLAAFEGRY